jgi:hypothetical protein
MYPQIANALFLETDWAVCLLNNNKNERNMKRYSAYRDGLFDTRQETITSGTA